VLISEAIRCYTRNLHRLSQFYNFHLNTDKRSVRERNWYHTHNSCNGNFLDYTPILRGVPESFGECYTNRIQFLTTNSVKVKGKGFPYSLPSVGPGADPGVQAVSPQVTIHPAVCCHYFPLACGYLPSRRASPPLRRYKVTLVGDRGA